MNNDTHSAHDATPAGLPHPPAWADCELFCINHYAGVANERCGWRGRFSETRWDVTCRVRPCPKCGAATLMELERNWQLLSD